MNIPIELTGKQRSELEHLLTRHADSRLYQRALALLLLDEGQSVEETAIALHVSRQSIYNWAWRFRQRDQPSSVERLADAERGGRPITVKGIIDPLIDTVIDSDPRDFGYNSTVWTAELLRAYLRERHQHETSLRSIGYALVRLRINWKRPRHALARREPNWRQAKGGLKRGLWTHPHIVVLMLDEVIITETPPLYCCYGRIGQQVCVPITGNRAKRILHGALNIRTGELLLLITEVWDEVTHQFFLEQIRRHWRGWRVILFEDRGTPHTAEDSLALARSLRFQVRLLPRACPELNAMDHLFRFVKGRGVANRPTRSIDESAMAACRSLYRLSRHERLTKAGVLSGDFWLTS